MRIKTYRAQAQRTGEAVAQPFNVQVRSAPFEAVGQSFVAMGDAVAANSAWMATEAKLVNAAEVSAGIDLFKMELEKVAHEIETDPALIKRHGWNPAVVSQTFKTRATSKRNKIISGGMNYGAGVTGNAAKRAFAAQAADLSTTARLKAKHNARVRLSSKAIVTALKEGVTLQNDLAQANPRDTALIQKKETELFGREAGPGLPKAIPGVYDKLVEVGHLTHKQGYEYEVKAQNNIAATQIGIRMLAANKMSLSADDMNSGVAANAMKQVLQDIQDNKYPNLTAQAKLDLMESANNQIDQLERSRNAEQTREASQEKAKRLNEQRINTLGILNTILEYKVDPENKDKQNALPNLTTIAKLQREGKISPADAKTIERALNDQGAFVADKKYFYDLLIKMRQAEDKWAIEALVTAAHLNTGTGKKLDWPMLRDLMAAADTYSGQTARAKQGRLLGSALDVMVKPTGILDKVLPGAAQRGSMIIAQFDATVSGYKKINPLEAFQIAIRQFESDNDVNIRELTPPRFPPQSAQGKQLVDWTLEEIAEAKENTLKEFSGAGTLLGLELFNIEMLHRYKSEVDPAVIKARKLLIEERANELKEENQ